MAQDQPTRSKRTIAVLSIVGGLFLVGGVAAFLLLSTIGSMYIRAFVVRSNSMCPTICERERVFANLAAYSTHPPRRGDVVIFDYLSEGNSVPYVKRVIGIPGDTISADSDGKILVNGKRFPIPPEKSVCGKPATEPDPYSEPVLFPATKVPEGSLFLVGDNLGRSFDSRYPNFSSVRVSQVRGKLLLIYWSSGSGRIGCSVR
jgi:signal peptidase I